MFINRRIVWTVLGILLFIGVAGCKSKFEQLRTSNNTALKYQEAIRYYEKERYSKAQVLFEDLITRYRGQAEAEDLYYYLAYTNYNMRDYTSARYAFNEFVRMYGNSLRAEECRFMGAYCYYLEAPRPSLDQEYTHRAIEALQLFINLYPDSERAERSAELIQELRDRLESKAFANAKLYLDMGLQYDYLAAVIAFDNALRDFPDTKYAEEMEFLSIKAQFLYAEKSTDRRKEERYNEAIDMYNSFAASYPESKWLREATSYRDEAEKEAAAARRRTDAQAAAFAAAQERAVADTTGGSR